MLSPILSWFFRGYLPLLSIPACLTLDIYFLASLSLFSVLNAFLLSIASYAFYCSYSFIHECQLYAGHILWKGVGIQQWIN